jgi:hypothetical protein
MTKQEFIEKLKQKIDSSYQIAKKNEHIKSPTGVKSYNAISKTCIRLVNSEERKEYNGTIDFILSYSHVKEGFSRNHIEKQINTILHKLLSNESDLSTLTDSFYSSLIKEPNDEWLVVSEIENIVLQNSTAFQFIDSIIKYNTDQNFPIDKEKHTSLVGFDFFQKPCIYTTVKAGDENKANTLAIRNFELSFALLRLYAPHSRPVLKGSFPLGNRDLLTYNTTKMTGSGSSSIACVAPSRFELNDDTYSRFKEEGIESLSNSAFGITEVVKNSLYWYKNGLNEELPSARLLDFVTILEATLKKETETDELKMRIADRCALLLGDNCKERKAIVKDISKIYTKRHKVVHKGTIIDDDNLVDMASLYARAVLIKLIKVNSEYNGKFGNFIDAIDNKKYL